MDLNFRFPCSAIDNPSARAAVGTSRGPAPGGRGAGREARGLRWHDLNLERGRLTVRQQWVQVSTDAPCRWCGQVHRDHSFGPPKTASGEARVVDLDSHTIGALLAHR